MNEIKCRDYRGSAWAAGLFDAEGHTGISIKKHHKYVRLSVAQNEPVDVLYDFQSIVGVGQVTPPRPNKRRKDGSITYRRDFVCRSQPEVKAVLEAIWPSLGEVKREQALYAISQQTSNFKFDNLLLTDPVLSDLEWAGGFFNGEGSTGVLGQIRIGQSHPEVLRRFFKTVDLGRLRGPVQEKYCNMWYYDCYNGAEEVLRQLWPYLSEIKKKQANRKYAIT
jgi:hypothetical protein